MTCGLKQMRQFRSLEYRVFQVFESPASFTLPRETITISGFADLIS